MLFLQEIDAITAPPQPAESSTASSAPPPTPPRPEPKESGSGQSSGTANGAGPAPAPEWQYDTQCSLAGGECLAQGLGAGGVGGGRASVPHFAH